MGQTAFKNPFSLQTDFSSQYLSGELFFKAGYYAEHLAFSETSLNTDISVETLFSMALKRQAEKKFSESKDKCEAVKA